MSDKLETLKTAYAEAETELEAHKAKLANLESAKEVDADAVKAAKADIRKSETAMRKAKGGIVKEEARLEREAERVAKKEAAEKEKAQRAEEREAKRKEREAEKAKKAAEREANRMPEQHGVRRPKPTTKCGQAWAIMDEVSKELAQPAPIAQVLERAVKAGLNEGNVKAEYARWRKFNGVTGRVSLPKPEKEEAAAETKAEA